MCHHVTYHRSVIANLQYYHMYMCNSPSPQDGDQPLLLLSALSLYLPGHSTNSIESVLECISIVCECFRHHMASLSSPDNKYLVPVSDVKFSTPSISLHIPCQASVVQVKNGREQHAITVLSIIATLCSIGFRKILLTDSSRPKAFSERNTKTTVEHSNNFQDYWGTRKQILQTQSILWQ